MIIGNREFKDRTYVMGILNVTPDSFSDGSKYNTLDRALKHTEEMIKDGMDIVDKIASTKTDDNNKPVEKVVIQSIDVTEYK
mgnify:CR=1 FL=1